MKDVFKTIAWAVIPPIIAGSTLLTIGYVADRLEKRKMIRDLEHYANCPKNHT